MTELTAPELLPCPFCGCTTTFSERMPGISRQYYTCKWCGAEGPAEFPEINPPQGWNHRTASPEVAALIAALAAALADLQALRDDLKRADEVADTLSEMWSNEQTRAEVAEAELVTLRAQMKRLKSAFSDHLSKCGPDDNITRKACAALSEGAAQDAAKLVVEVKHRKKGYT